MVTSPTSAKLLKIFTYIISGYAFIFLLSLLLLLLVLLFHLNQDLIANFIIINIWALGWVFIVGLLLSLRFKTNTKVNGKPTTLARILVFVNIAALVAIPAVFVIIFVGYALTCTGSC